MSSHAEGLVPPVSLDSQHVRGLEVDWPVLRSQALHGLAGEIVRAIEPHTESDPVALLASVLATFGAAVGRGPHAAADGVEHPGRLFVVLVGDSAKARKGSSWAQVRRVFAIADPVFVQERVIGGFGSGEALVDAASTDGDKRMLVIEPEWARVLTVAKREGSTLSHLLRQAWDGERLAIRSRSLTVAADDAHVAALGHVTTDEIRRKLNDTEIANGFANRHLLVRVRRSKMLPSGGNLEIAVIERLGGELRRALERARTFGEMRRTKAAEIKWNSLYFRMGADDPGGLLGSLIARDSAQVLRLSVIYALMDGSREIDECHVDAAFAVWMYCRESARTIFGDSLGSPVADRLLAAIRAAGPLGLSATDQSRALSGHAPKQELDAARQDLEERRLIFSQVEPTRGAPVTISVAAEHAKRANQAKQDSAYDAPPLEDRDIESYSGHEDSQYDGESMD